MLNSNKSQILIISPEPWDGLFVSKHHYAITLTQLGCEVYFLNPPTASLKNITISNTNYNNLYKVDAPQVFKGLRFFTKKIRNYLEKRWLEKFEVIIGKKFTTIWLFENSRCYDMDFAEDKLKIYHQVDSNQNFHIKEAASSADICFCVTDFIKRDLQVHAKKVFKISHGINLSNEKKPLSKDDIDKFKKDGIHATCIGNFDATDIHENIFYNLVKSFPNVNFHFVGNYSKKRSFYNRFKNQKNIIWWGRVDSTFIPSILERVDINLLAYRYEDYPEQTANSHKILEYLYSGKVIVATYTDEYKDKRYLLEMVDSSNDYIQKFSQVINNIDFYNAIEKQQERILFAKNSSYEKRLELIINILKENNLYL
jgi:hypothetical protein